MSLRMPTTKTADEIKALLFDIYRYEKKLIRDREDIDSEMKEEENHIQQHKDNDFLSWYSSPSNFIEGSSGNINQDPLFDILARAEKNRYKRLLLLAKQYDSVDGTLYQIALVKGYLRELNVDDFELIKGCFIEKGSLDEMMDKLRIGRTTLIRMRDRLFGEMVDTINNQLKNSETEAESMYERKSREHGLFWNKAV